MAHFAILNTDYKRRIDVYLKSKTRIVFMENPENDRSWYEIQIRRRFLFWTWWKSDGYLDNTSQSVCGYFTVWKFQSKEEAQSHIDKSNSDKPIIRRTICT